LRELVSLLKRVGLNDYESKSYLALLRLGSATASQVSKQAGIPRARVYDVLMSLERKGFIVLSPSRPLKFNVLPVQIALKNFEELEKKNFNARLEELSTLKKELLKKTQKIQEKFLEGENVLLLRGQQKIFSTIESALSKCKEEVIISTNELNAIKKINAFKQKFEALKRRGVSIVFKLDKASNLKNPVLKAFKNLIKINSSQNNSRFVVFDSNKVLLFLDNSKEKEDSALLIESPFLASFFKKL
jgi:sugar-specific transcriptional regulator TrmB